jgi:hypothetical protein
MRFGKKVRRCIHEAEWRKRIRPEGWRQQPQRVDEGHATGSRPDDLFTAQSDELPTQSLASNQQPEMAGAKLLHDSCLRNSQRQLHSSANNITVEKDRSRFEKNAFGLQAPRLSYWPM